MIWDLLEWVLQLNQTYLKSLTAIKSNQASNFVLACYMLSFKRSYAFAMAFLLCEILANLEFFGAFQPLGKVVGNVLTFLALCLTWSLSIKSQIKPRTNKSLAAWCCIMVSFLLYMAIDRVLNPYDKTYIYRHYENVIVCIHACIILSLYKPRAIINSMVDKFRDIISQLRSSYTMQFICYNLEQCKTFLAK